MSNLPFSSNAEKKAIMNLKFSGVRVYYPQQFSKESADRYLFENRTIANRIQQFKTQYPDLGRNILSRETGMDACSIETKNHDPNPVQGFSKTDLELAKFLVEEAGLPADRVEIFQKMDCVV
jgi:hypothetical protein